MQQYRVHRWRLEMCTHPQRRTHILQDIKLEDVTNTYESVPVAAWHLAAPAKTALSQIDVDVVDAVGTYVPGSNAIITHAKPSIKTVFSLGEHTR
jgi:hypothetical protein